jgi:Uma2 family endonuclease
MGRDVGRSAPHGGGTEQEAYTAVGPVAQLAGLVLGAAGRQSGRFAHQCRRRGRLAHDYRIPNIVLLTPERFAIDRDEYYDGAPAVVVEIRSPGDETREKLAFYAVIGVPEVWVVDRDTRVPQVFQLARGDYQEVSADADRWLRSAATGVWLRAGPASTLEVQMADHVATRHCCTSLWTSP